MAQLIDNPWSFGPGDTSDTTIYANFRFKICNVIFSEYGSAGDACELQDLAGHTIFSTLGNADFSAIISNRVHWVNGIKVPTMTTAGLVNIPSGRLFVYFE